MAAEGPAHSRPAQSRPAQSRPAQSRPARSRRGRFGARQWTMMGSACAVLFLAVLADVKLGGLGTRFDAWVNGRVLDGISAQARQRWFEVGFSAAGDVMWAGVAALGIAALIAVRRWPWALAYIGTVWATQLTVQALKVAVARPRPFTGLTQTLSFPSGHSATAAVTFILGSLILVRVYDLPRRREDIGVAAAIVLVLSVGLARILAGVHYPTDVAGGFLIAMVSTSALMLWWKHEAPRERAIAEHKRAEAQQEHEAAAQRDQGR